ncbi:hypothetical protein HDU91_001617, partial [Kappamyces sp. JEL0680]
MDGGHHETLFRILEQVRPTGATTLFECVDYLLASGCFLALGLIPSLKFERDRATCLAKAFSLIQNQAVVVHQDFFHRVAHVVRCQAQEQTTLLEACHNLLKSPHTMSFVGPELLQPATDVLALVYLVLMAKHTKTSGVFQIQPSLLSLIDTYFLDSNVPEPAADSSPTASLESVPVSSLVSLPPKNVAQGQHMTVPPIKLPAGSAKASHSSAQQFYQRLKGLALTKQFKTLKDVLGDAMRNNNTPWTLGLYDLLIFYHLDENYFGSGRELIEHMESHGVQGSIKFYANWIAREQKWNPPSAKALFDYALTKFKPDQQWVYMETAIALASSGQTHEAELLLQEFPVIFRVYRHLIQAFLYQHDIERALHYLGILIHFDFKRGTALEGPPSPQPLKGLSVLFEHFFRCILKDKDMNPVIACKLIAKLYDRHLELGLAFDPKFNTVERLFTHLYEHNALSTILFIPHLSPFVKVQKFSKVLRQKVLRGRTIDPSDFEAFSVHLQHCVDGTEGTLDTYLRHYFACSRILTEGLYSPVQPPSFGILAMMFLVELTRFQ